MSSICSAATDLAPGKCDREPLYQVIPSDMLSILPHHAQSPFFSIDKMDIRMNFFPFPVGIHLFRVTFQKSQQLTYITPVNLTSGPAAMSAISTQRQVSGQLNVS